MPSPIVFAVTVWESGLKCVDYYMTWRGKTVSDVLLPESQPIHKALYILETSKLQRKASLLRSFAVLGLT